MNEKELLQALYDKVSGMDERFDGIDRRLDAMDLRFDEIDHRLDAMDLRFDEMEHNFNDLKQTVHNMGVHLENLTDKSIRILAENHSAIIDKLNQAIPAAEKNLIYEVKVDYCINKVNHLELEVQQLKNHIA